MNPKRSIGIGVWLGLATGAAIAQEVAQEAPTLPRVDVAAPRAPDKRDLTTDPAGLPTGTSVIEHEDAERSNLGRNVGDLLRRVPGAMSNNIGQGDTGTSIRMRGFFTASHGADVAVTIDGMPQNIPSSAINHGMNDMSWLTPDMIERITLIKGPFSALYGDQNRAGAVDIVTRSSAPDSVALSLGSDNTRRASATLSRRLGEVRTLLVADQFNTDGWRDHSGQSRSSVFLKGTLRQGDSVWSARGDWSISHWEAPGFLNLADLQAGRVSPRSRDLSAPPLFGRSARSTLVVNRDPASGEEGLHATAYAENDHRTRSLGASATELNVQTDDRRILGGRVLYHLAIGAKGLLTFGADTRSDKGTAAIRRVAPSGPTATFSLDQDLDLLTWGLFAQGQYKPLDNLKLLAGIRHDVFDYDLANRKLPAASLGYRKSVDTPRAGIVWTPVERFDLFANVGEGMRSPSQAELSPSGAAGPLGAAGGSSFPDLKPPKVRSQDFGFDARLTDRWKLYGARYHTLNDNEIAQVAPGVFATVGNTRRDGFEFETRYTPDVAWSFYGSWGRIIRASILSAAAGTADRLSVPRDTVKAGAAYTTPFQAGTLLLNADASWVGATPYFAGTPLRLQYAKAYARYDLRVAYDLGRVTWTTFATFQPIRYGSEFLSGSAAGLLVDPRPRLEGGVSARWRF